jgi:peptidoglycan/xylan/chitin deacetylase (PgdA/CDA1 family)
VRKQLKEGFVLGDHTENHLPMAGKPRALQNTEITDEAAQLFKYTGVKPNLFRPPTGVWDLNTRQLLKRKGMVAVFWAIDTEDYTRPGTQRIVDEVLSGASPGATVLMHDGGGDRTQTLAALPAIIKGLKQRGYTLVTIPRMLHDAPPRKKLQAPFGSGPGL